MYLRFYGVVVAFKRDGSGVDSGWHVFAGEGASGVLIGADLRFFEGGFAFGEYFSVWVGDGEGDFIAGLAVVKAGPVDEGVSGFAQGFGVYVFAGLDD